MAWHGETTNIFFPGNDYALRIVHACSPVLTVLYAPDCNDHIFTEKKYDGMVFAAAAKTPLGDTLDLAMKTATPRQA